MYYWLLTKLGPAQKNKVSKIIDKLKIWWRGELIPTTLEEALGEVPDRGIQFDRPWLARRWVSLKTFYLNHWKWIIGTAIAVAVAIFL